MDPNEAKYQLLINKRKGSRLKHFNDSKAFVDYSNDIDYIYHWRIQSRLKNAKYWLYLLLIC